MDEVKTVRERTNGKQGQTAPELRPCRYCKGKFEVNPAFHWKEFCSDSHRKLYWKYGSQSIGKVAQRIERDMRKLIADEIAGLNKRVSALERGSSSAASGLPPTDGTLSTLRARLDAIESFVRSFLSFTSSVRVEVPSGWTDPEAGEPANIDWATIDEANARLKLKPAKRGGGAGA